MDNTDDARLVERLEEEAALCEDNRESAPGNIAELLREAAAALRGSGAVTEEPVAWRYRYRGTTHWKYVNREDECNLSTAYEMQPLYSRALDRIWRAGCRKVSVAEGTVQW